MSDSRMGVQLCGWCFRRSPCQPTQFHSSRLTVFPCFCVCVCSMHLLHYVIFSYSYLNLIFKAGIFFAFSQQSFAILGRERFQAAQSCNFVIFLQIRSEQGLLGWMRFTLGGFRASCMSGHVRGRDQLLIKRLLLLQLLQYDLFTITCFFTNTSSPQFSMSGEERAPHQTGF